MNRYYDIAFSEQAKELQREKGSRQLYEEAEKDWPSIDEIGPNERSHIESSDSFYLSSVSESGWPYVQHRGGDKGFVKVIGPNTIGWIERNGNRQYVSGGNLAADGRVSLILMDYAMRTRLKIFGHATHHPNPTDGLIERLDGAGLRNDGAITVEVAGLEWNCPKYITQRFTSAEVAVVTGRLESRIAELEAELATKT